MRCWHFPFTLLVLSPSCDAKYGPAGIHFVTMNYHQLNGLASIWSNNLHVHDLIHKFFYKDLVHSCSGKLDSIEEHDLLIDRQECFLLASRFECQCVVSCDPWAPTHNDILKCIQMSYVMSSHTDTNPNLFSSFDRQFKFVTIMWLILKHLIINIS